jgi:RNA polymerase sigma-70 factor (ECF subfamily)
VTSIPVPRLASDREETLEARLARAEPAAVAEVYDRHHRRVRAFARRMLGDDASAEDVVQEVFLAVPKAMTRFRGDGSLAGYLIGIAARRCEKHRRSAARRRAAMGRFEEERRHLGSASDDDPERRSRRRALAAALQRGLDRLSIKHRAVFILAAVEERSSPEVATILGIPEGTVRTRLHHARKKLRAHLEGEGLR